MIALLVAPLYVDAFWLNLGGFAFAASIGAIGLTILYGRVGQLSLAHSFFLAVGAYGYLFFASPAVEGSWGMGLPPLLAVGAAVVLSAVVGLAFSPLSRRLKGISIGVATLALIFIGEHVLYAFPELSGGFNGRSVPDLTIGGFAVIGNEPAITLLGVPFGRPERLWVVAGLTLLATALLASRILRGRVGRAYIAVRDSEQHAAALGIDVNRTRSSGFMVSAVLAGLSGVLLALAFRRIVPEYWSLMLSLQYLAMVIIGGLGSIRGAVGGAAFVTALPLLLQRYGEAVPGLSSDPGAPFPPSVVAQLVFGLLIVVVLMRDPRGIAHQLTQLRARWRARSR
ncbi:branched-chain amino acid ABC transporter permease [Nocardioides humi]|uniref:Branched-chain amino acid ABC transporter permease n=1 Tax=Nocardioides humi TaxID=449461 RepID=A0ABN1ZZV0_9ACTN